MSARLRPAEGAITSSTQGRGCDRKRYLPRLRCHLGQVEEWPKTICQRRNGLSKKGEINHTDLSNLKKTLKREEIRQLFRVKFGKKPYIIGAPHHTPGGVKYMPCKEHKDGDENAGFLALTLAEHLRGQCIIASNYWLDANKTCNDYLLFIIQKQPKFLIEVHGHGGSANSDIEISCGTDELTDKSEELARYVYDEIKILRKNGKVFWNDVTVCGTFSKIKFKAQQTLSLSCARDCEIIPYHIEISPKFRIGEVDEKDENKKFKKVPKEGEELMKIIAKFFEESGGN